MSNRNEFSAGLAAKLVGAIADAGGTPDEANRIAESNDLIRRTLGILRGTVQTVFVKFILEVVNAKIAIPALKKPFVVKDFFRVDTSRKAKVKISYLGDNFRAWFLDQKVDPRNGFVASIRKLLQPSVDQPILNELGPVYEMDMAAVYSRMEVQPNGEKLYLLTNGWANIFYVKDTAGVLRAVCVDWSGDGWGVRASEVDSPASWDDGRQVFSRNS